MLRVSVVSRFPLYRQSIGEILRRCISDIDVRELCCSTAEPLTLIGSDVVIVIGDKTSESLSDIWDQLVPVKQIRILLSEVFGNIHRTLIRKASYHRVLPLRASVEDLESYFRRLLGSPLNLKNIPVFCGFTNKSYQKDFYADINDLTRNEKQVMELISNGLSNDQISNFLGRKQSSIKASITRIRSKLGLKSRYQMVILYSRCPCGV